MTRQFSTPLPLVLTLVCPFVELGVLHLLKDVDGLADMLVVGLGSEGLQLLADALEEEGLEFLKKATLLRGDRDVDGAPLLKVAVLENGAQDMDSDGGAFVRRQDDLVVATPRSLLSLRSQAQMDHVLASLEGSDGISELGGGNHGVEKRYRIFAVAFGAARSAFPTWNRVGRSEAGRSHRPSLRFPTAERPPSANSRKGSILTPIPGKSGPRKRGFLPLTHIRELDKGTRRSGTEDDANVKVFGGSFRAVGMCTVGGLWPAPF